MAPANGAASAAPLLTSVFPGLQAKPQKGLSESKQAVYLPRVIEGHESRSCWEPAGRCSTRRSGPVPGSRGISKRAVEPRECHCHMSAPRTRLGWAAAAGCTFRGGFGIPIPPQAQLGHIQPAPALPSRQICRCRWDGEAGTGSCHAGETCLVRAKDPRASRKHWLFPCIVRFSARHPAGAGKNDSEQSEQCLISPGTFYVHVCVRERESKSDSRWLLGNAAWLRSSSRPRVRTLPSTHMGRGHRDVAVPPAVASWQKDRARPLVSVRSGHSISRCCPWPVRTCLPEGWRDASLLFHGHACGWSVPRGLAGYPQMRGQSPVQRPEHPTHSPGSPRSSS